MYRLSLCALLLCFIGNCSSQPSRNIIGNCAYQYQNESPVGPYECVFSSQPFKNEDAVTSIVGVHVEGMDDDSVTTVRVPRNTPMPIAPTIFCEKFKNLKFLILSFVHLRTITDNSFSRCANIESISISQNQLLEITANVFEKNVQLRQLAIQDNELIRIEGNPFRNLANLEVLELHRNRIEGIGAQTFTGLPSLRSLSLFTNRIPELPLNVFSELLSLQNLQLFNNQIRRVHPDFLDSLPDTEIDVTIWNNICISQAFTFTKERVDEIKPLFNECFDNFMH